MPVFHISQHEATTTCSALQQLPESLHALRAGNEAGEDFERNVYALFAHTL